MGRQGRCEADGGGNDCRRIDEARRKNTDARERDDVSQINRRDFLKTAGVASAALALPGAPGGAATAAAQTRANETGAQRKKKKIIVVGAGLAGLVATYELDRAGHDVVLLEAQLRPGGRVLTWRQEFSDGLHAEVGAARILNTHELTLRYARQFQLKLGPYFPTSGNLVNQVGGLDAAAPLGGHVHWPVALTAAEERMGRIGMWEHYAAREAKQLGNPAAPGWSPASFADLDSIAFPQFLRRRGASAGAVRVMLLGMDYGDVSALRVLAEMAANGDVTAQYKIVGGMDRLPRAMAERLSDRIRYGAAVQTIEHDKTGVRAGYLQGNLLRTLVADYLICTIPFPALRRVQFTPLLSDYKQTAVANTSYMSAALVISQEQRRYWLSRGDNGFARSDWPIEVTSPTFDQPGRRGLLTATLTGNLALRVSGLPEDRRIVTVQNEVETIFPGARENFEGAVTKSWDNDFWERGAWQWFHTGQMTAYGPYMATPEGRVHFAGEHTSAWAGWMEGAIQSGVRAAKEVEEAA